MASPAALVDGLAAAFPLLDEFGRRLRTPDASADTERETDRQVDIWKVLVAEKLAGNKSAAKVGVRSQLLERWLGERLISRCIQVDTQDLAMAQVQQIVDSLVPDVPVERKKTNPAGVYETCGPGTGISRLAQAGLLNGELPINTVNARVHRVRGGVVSDEVKMTHCDD